MRGKGWGLRCPGWSTAEQSHALSCSPQPSGFRGPARPSLGPMACSGTDPGGGSLCSGVPVALLQCPSVYGARERVCRLINRKGKVMCLHFGFLFLQRAGILSLLRKGTLQNRRVWQDPFVKLSGVWRALTSRGSVSLSQEGKFDLRALSFPPPAPCSSVRPLPPLLPLPLALSFPTLHPFR